MADKHSEMINKRASYQELSLSHSPHYPKKHIWFNYIIKILNNKRLLPPEGSNIEGQKAALQGPDGGTEASAELVQVLN